MIIASLCGLVERVTTSQDEVLDVRKGGIYTEDSTDDTSTHPRIFLMTTDSL